MYNETTNIAYNPNIIHIHDLGKVGDSYFIAMEYLFGRDMRRVMPKCEQQGIAYHETGLVDSYVQVLRHLNTVGGPLRPELEY